jgi:predicted PurR-regulated permease PerM
VETKPAARVRLEIAPSAIVWVLSTAAVVWLFIQLWSIALVLIVALVFAGTLNPLVEWAEARGLRRPAALLALFVGLTLTSGVLLFFTIPPIAEQFNRIVQDAPADRIKLIQMFEKNGLTAPLARAVRGIGLEKEFARLEGTLLGYSSQALTGVGYAVTTLFLAFYLMADGKRTQGALYAVVPRDYHMRLARIIHNLETIVGGYMRGQLITSAAIAGFTFVLMVLCRLPNALSLALFAGLTDVIPFVGGLLATLPVVLVALSVGIPRAAFVGIAMWAYQEFENRVLVPRVYGQVLRLSPAVVVLSLMAGAILLGALGALLALPVAAGLQMILKELRVDMPGDDSDDPSARAKNEKTEAAYERMSAGSTAPEAGRIAKKFEQENRMTDAVDTAKGESNT